MSNYSNTPNRGSVIPVEVLVGALIIGLILGLVTLFSSMGTVPVGHRGVVIEMSRVTGEVLNEGFYWKKPFITSVEYVDVRQQSVTVKLDAASSDLQKVTATIALNYSVDPERVAELYQTIGPAYAEIVIDPSMSEIFKDVTAKFTAEHLITHRDQPGEQMLEKITTRMKTAGLNTIMVSTKDFHFSESFDHSIEQKVVAEQEALAAKNRLERTKYEAQQLVETARGKAEAMRLEAETLRANPAILQLRALEKWDGILPKVTGSGGIPLLNLQDLTNASKT